MDIRQIKAIDMHSHFNHGVLHEPATTPAHIRELNYLIQMNKAANIEISMYSTFSSVLHPELVVEENAYLFEFVQEYDWMYQWVVIDPRNPATYRQASKMLNHGKCVGIKLHPGSHKYDFTEFGDEIFSFAAGFQRGRIEYALISEEDKANILRNNALQLFGRFF